MTATGDKVLMAIAARDGAPVTAADLCADLGCQASSVLAQFKSLAQKGYVCSTPASKRAAAGRPPTWWQLSDAGWERVAEVAQTPPPLVHPLVSALKEIREKQQLSATRAGVLAGLGSSTVHGWDRCERSPRLNQVARYARVLGYEITITPIPEGDPR